MPVRVAIVLDTLDDPDLKRAILAQRISVN